MVQWYKNNQRLFREEREALAARFPLMQLILAKPEFKMNSEFSLKSECAVAYGTYELNVPGMCQEIDYKISVLFPEKYSKNPPTMYCNDEKLPMYNIDRHILKNGYACLGVQAEIRQKWPQGSLIVDFIENIIEPFLAWQAYYDEFQKVPPWGERSHFPDGILEYYAELLQLSESGLIKDFMTLLARKNNPKGHEFCPCQSGKRLRHCHRELIDNVRKIINWEVVGLDLKQINSFESKK